MPPSSSSREALSHLYSFTPEALVEFAATRGLELRIDDTRRYLASRLSDPDERPSKLPMAKAKAAALAELLSTAELEVVERVTDEFDGFEKYLFRSPDGALTEAVRIPLHKPGHFTVCLSSQVGCAMECDFCATGRLGLTRNLESWEMFAAFKRVRDDAHREGRGRVSGAVFMGQGEPLHNYDRVIATARVLSHPCGGRIDARNITISTVGLVAQIRRFARERHPYKLIVSLTSAVDERRRALLPVAGRSSLDELESAIREYAAVMKGRMTLAWVLIGGLNHGPEEVEALHRRFGDLPIRVNLIDVNDARPGGYRRATPAELRAFLDRLQILGAPIVRRYSGGKDKHAACGMLAATRQAEESGASA